MTKKEKRVIFFRAEFKAAPLSSLWDGLWLGMLAWSWRFAIQCLFLSVTRCTWLGVFNVIACAFNMEADCPGFRNGSHICEATKVAENRCKEDRFVACFLLCVLRAAWRQLAEDPRWLLQDLQVPLVLSLLGGSTFQPPFCDTHTPCHVKSRTLPMPLLPTTCSGFLLRLNLSLALFWVFLSGV